MQMSKKRKGYLFIIMGVLLLAAAAVLYVFNKKQDALAGQNAQILYEGFTNEVRFVYSPEEDSEEYHIDLGGYLVLGSIEVREAGIELPVLDNWSYDLLKAAPCRYSGAVSTDDLIIMGHNYESHFKPLERVPLGAEVVFTDAGGRKHLYTVSKVETLDKKDVAELESGEWPLSLFTCNYSGQGRIVVRCEIVE